MNFQGGLQPTLPDNRDLGGFVELPQLSELPDSFVINDSLPVKHQGDTDFCSAYMSCAMSEPQEGFELEPSWSFAISKKISGNLDSWGQNIRDALKAHQKYGALPTYQSPFSIENKDPKFLRDINNWPDLSLAAYPQRKKAYVRVSGQYDHFDNARASLWRFKNRIGTGVLWGWPMTQSILNSIPANGFGHAVTIIGYDRVENGDLALVIQNSYGDQYGNKGLFYITRDVYNHFADIYGQWQFIDMSPDEVRWYMQHGIKLGDSWVVQFKKLFINIIKLLWTRN